MAELSILDDPTLTAFLPMIYVAWADGDLGDDEVSAICSQMSADPAIEGSCREVLSGWLNPDQPPSASELNALLLGIRNRATSLDVSERHSLTDLGLAIAEVDSAPTATERSALEQIEEALGVASAEAARQILTPTRPSDPDTEAPAPTFDVSEMQSLLAGKYAATRDEIRSLLREPEFAYPTALPKDEYRDLVLGWCQTIAERGFGALSYPDFAGGKDDTAAFVVAFEALAEHDLSLLIKFGVQFGLFGGSIQQLGTERHHREYLPRVGTLELPGCFAMTETGHGSNVRDIETTATYDAHL